MAKPYPPIRSLVLRSLDGGQKTAAALRYQLTPDAENSMTMARLLGVMAAAGVVEKVPIRRDRATDPLHAYRLALPLEEALEADEAAFRAVIKARNKRKRSPKPERAAPTPPPVRIVGIPAGATLSLVAGGGECYTLGALRIFKLETARREISTDCIGNKPAPLTTGRVTDFD